MESAIQGGIGTAGLDTPREVFNCPGCGHWLPPGTLACPDCQAIVYVEHLRDLAIAARSEEQAKRWPESRAVWVKALAWLPPGTEQHATVVGRIEQIDAALGSAAAKKAKWTKRLGPLAPIVFYLAKFKTYFLLLTKAKFLLSFAGFFLVYWALFGWKFGLGFAVSILLHEMGHYVAAWRRGLKVDLPVFLPGLGAYVRWYSMGVSLDDLSGIALAGPLAGMLVALCCAAIAKGTGETFDHPGLWSALAHVTAWLNIINLTPVFGLDGAQATFSLNRTQRWLVLATTLIFFGVLQEWPFLAVAAGMAWRIFRGGGAEQASTKSLVKYVLILFLLGAVMYSFPDSTQRF